MCLTVPSVVIGVSNRVLHVAGDIMGGALGLVDFAFRLQLLIAGYLAGCVLDGAFHLVGSALHMFAIHVHSPFCGGWI